MTFTPTMKGSFLAGIGLWLMLWLGLFKLDEVVHETPLRRFASSEGCFRWISKHRSTTLLGTELVNYGTHGIINPEGVVFAAGGTIVNVVDDLLRAPAAVTPEAKANATERLDSHLIHLTPPNLTRRGRQRSALCRFWRGPFPFTPTQ